MLIFCKHCVAPGRFPAHSPCAHAQPHLYPGRADRQFRRLTLLRQPKRFENEEQVPYRWQHRKPEDPSDDHPAAPLWIAGYPMINDHPSILPNRDCCRLYRDVLQRKTAN